MDRADTNRHYLPLFEQDPDIFRQKCAPIYPSEELSPNLSTKQRDYIKWLVGNHERVNIDFTRCNFKLRQLRELFPEALIIHLHRSPTAFVSSHITPSYKEKGLRGLLARKYRKASFFTRKSRYNFYNYEQVIEEFYPELFDDFFQKNEALQGKSLGKTPAYIKMLLLHRLNQQRIDDFKTAYPDNFFEWQFEHFLSEPHKHLRELYTHFGKEVPVFDFSKLRKPNLGYKANSPAWNVI